jgi:hypothetical protein
VAAALRRRGYFGSRAVEAHPRPARHLLGLDCGRRVSGRDGLHLVRLDMRAGRRIG